MWNRQMLRLREMALNYAKHLLPEVKLGECPVCGQPLVYEFEFAVVQDGVESEYAIVCLDNWRERENNDPGEVKEYRCRYRFGMRQSGCHMMEMWPDLLAKWENARREKGD